MKILVRSLFVVLVLGLMAVVAVALGLDALARTAVEKGGTFALGVDTHLAQADIGLLSGTTRLTGLEIANPPGFDPTPFMSLGQAELALSLSSLRSDVIEVPLLSLSDVAVLLQKRDGRTNYGVILDHLERFESEREPAGEPSEPRPEPTPEPEDEGKRFLIRTIEITNVSVDLDLLGVGGELTRAKVTIPRLELEDVGTAEGGATVAQITGRVVQALLQAAVEAGGQVLGPELLVDLKGKLRELGVQTVDLGSGVKGELERILPGLGEKAGEALKGLDESLEGLLNKKQKEK